MLCEFPSNLVLFCLGSTLKKSLDFFKLRKSQLLIFLFIYLGATPPPLPHECFSDPSAETEQVSLAHLQLAHNVREEAKKLEEFRLDQKERRKKVGAAGAQAPAPSLGNQVRVAVSDGANDRRAPQTEVHPVQEDNGGT